MGRIPSLEEHGQWFASGEPMPVPPGAKRAPVVFVCVCHGRSCPAVPPDARATRRSACARAPSSHRRHHPQHDFRWVTIYRTQPCLRPFSLDRVVLYVRS